METVLDIVQRYTGNIYDSPVPGELEKLKVDLYNKSAGSLNSDGYNCSVCNNKGVILKAVEDASGFWSITAFDCDCMKVRKTIRKMERSGLKNIIKDYTFGKFKVNESWQDKLKTAALDYVKEKEGWFFIGGQSGSGKTHICTAICREFLLEGMSVKYMLWRDDIAALKNSIADPECYKKQMEELKNAEVLYIDDLFKTGRTAEGIQQKPTVADINIAFEILNYRYNNKNLLTIISSECTMNDLLDIDEATGGRIFERAKNAFSMKPDRSRNYRLKGCVEL